MFTFNVTSFDAKALKKTVVIFAQEKSRLLAEGEALDKLCRALECGPGDLLEYRDRA